MVKLIGHSLQAGEYFSPETMQLTLEERQGSASMTLGPEAPALAVDEWLRDDTEPGKGIVWRVRTVEQNYQTGTRTVTLEHLIATLRDAVIFGSLTPEDMGGTAAGVNARTAVMRVLTYQNDWRLGSFGYPNNVQPFEFTGDTVGNALDVISSTCEDAEWSYDFSAYPFTINIMPRGTDIAEMRGNRNLTTARKSIDRTGMYTRIYPIGRDDLHLPEECLSQNTATYGVVSKIETDQTMTTVEQLRAWASARLARHCEPTVTVTVTGLDLSQATGEPLDRLSIGKQCRIPMPELGTAIAERIVKLNWRDKIRQKENVTMTLANASEDVATIMRREQNKSGGGGGAKSAKNDAEDHAWFVDTVDHVGMVAEAVAGEGADQDWSRVAAVMVDGQGVHQRVTKTENDLVTAQAAIEVLEDNITLEVKARKTADSEQSAQIKLVSDQIALKVSNGEVATQLAVECGNVRVDGGNLVVDGIVTADAVNAALGKINVASIKGLLVTSTASFDSTVNINGIEYILGQLNVQDSGSFRFKGYGVTWKRQFVSTGLSRTYSTTFVDKNGHEYTGSLVTDYTSDYIYYLGR